VFTACEKDDGIVDYSSLQLITEELSFPTTNPSIQLQNDLLSDYAKLLAMSMPNSELRKVLKREVIKKFDGDYNVLAKVFEEVDMKEKSQKVKSILTSNSKLSTGRKLIKSSSNLSVDSLLDVIKEQIPNLQVSIPVLCEEWNEEEHVPLVAFVPANYQEKTDSFVVAFDTKGNTYKLSSKIEPNYPVVIVGISERVDRYGNLKSQSPILSETISFDKLNAPPSAPASITLSHGSAKSLILHWSDVNDDNGYEVWRKSQGQTQFVKIATTNLNHNVYINSNLTANTKYSYMVRAINNDGYSAWSPIITTTASPRNDGEWLRVKRMKFTSAALAAVEDWISGEPEFRLRVVQGNQNSQTASNVFTSGLLEPKKRNDIKDKWWEYQFDIFQWETSVYGTVLTFDWREEDWYDNITFSISGNYEDKISGGAIKAGGTFTVKDDEGEDHIGNTSVFWWQNKNQQYNLTGFYWEFVN
jgi:hypothetical protein